MGTGVALFLRRRKHNTCPPALLTASKVDGFMILKRLFSLIIILLMLVLNTVVPAEAVSVNDLNRRIISESAILIDADTGQILYGKNIHKVLRPASITKVMTGLLALENGDLNDEIIATRNALRINPEAASIFLAVGEKVTLEQVMYAMAVVSAGDASNVIAEHIGGTVSNFIKLMNERAYELGALNTNFINAHGMPDPNHRTTAYDMSLIVKAAIDTPGFCEIFSTHRYDMPSTNKRDKPRIFRNLNRMMTGAYKYEGLIAGKTGWTQLF